MGTNVLNKLYKNNRDDFYFLAINTDASHLDNNVMTPDEYKLFIDDKPEHSCGKRDFESGLEYVKLNKQRIKKTIKKYKASRIIFINVLHKRHIMTLTLK
ncbi:MAG: hypothetical protein PHW82_05640 [Bacteroidales bacterium]|nr:hypothetical protein [Bacteroidales bacterium]